MKEIQERFSIIEDPRHQGYVEHKLSDVLIMVMCAVLCGLDTLGDIVIYAQNNKEFFKDQLEIKNIPSKATFGRILSMIDGAKVGEVILGIMQEQFGMAGDVVAVDGKAICSTSKPGQAHSALQILTAYITSSGVILGQEAIHEKTNEIPVFQQMLSYLDIEGKIVTADAMHCQKETCRKIIEKKGEYLIGLKGNQQTLYEDIALFCGDVNNREMLERHTTIEKNAGRIEKRNCSKITDLTWLEGREKWPGLQSIISIERIVDVRGHSSKETSYYISSLDASAQRLMEIAREHWKIESMHWLLDVTFSEDHCRFLEENAHKTLNALRKYALVVHKQFLARSGKKSTIKANMLSCLLNRKLLLQMLEIL